MLSHIYPRVPRGFLPKSFLARLSRWPVGLLATCVAISCFAQTVSTASSTPSDQPSAPDVSVDVNVVNVLATVRDKHGKIVSDLKQDDFSLEEDGHPVSIHYFSRETNLPLTLGLLVDTSMSQRSVLQQERSASKTFLDQVLRENDKAFVIHFDREVELLQDLTSNKQKLEDAIEQIGAPSFHDQDTSSTGNTPPDDNSRNGGHGRGTHHGGTTLYDSVFLAADELMKKEHGRKAVIVLSDGVDRGSKENQEGAIEAAQRSDMLVYAVYFKGEEDFGNRGGFGYPGGGGMGGHHGGGGRRYPPQEEQHVDGKKILERISRETGSRMYEASKKQTIDQIYSSIQEELRNQYNLGFTPDKSDTPGYHKLALKTKEKDAAIQAREGYYLSR